MIDTARRQIVRDAWRLAKHYWTSEEKCSAWGLLLAVIALNLGNVYISVRINAWNNGFYNALRALNSGELFASSTPAASWSFSPLQCLSMPSRR